MDAKTITLRSDLVDRLETLAREQGRTLDEVFRDLLEQYLPTSDNWALNLATAMEEAGIDWQDNPSLSSHSRESFKQYVYEKWQRTQDD